MKAIYDLELPYDIAVITSDNNSLFFVLLFSSPQKAEYFHQVLIYKREVGLEVMKDDTEKFIFIFSSSNSPQAIIIRTDRTLGNNPVLAKILENDYKEYSYLTCGHKDREKVLYDIQNSYPLFVRHNS